MCREGLKLIYIYMYIYWSGPGGKRWLPTHALSYNSRCRIAFSLALDLLRSHGSCERTKVLVLEAFHTWRGCCGYCHSLCLYRALSLWLIFVSLRPGRVHRAPLSRPALTTEKIALYTCSLPPLHLLQCLFHPTRCCT